MRHVKWGRAALAGLMTNVASFIVGGGGYLLCGDMFALEPASVWRWAEAGGVLEWLGEMSAGWWAYLIVGNTLLAVLLGVVYAVLYHGIPGGEACRGVRKGLCYGLLLWLVGILPAAFTVHVLTVISGWTILYLVAQGLVEALAYGALIAVVYGRARPVG